MVLINAVDAAAEDNESQESIMQKFATAAPMTAVIAIPAGRVRIIAGDQEYTTVEVKPAQAGKSRDVKAAEQAAVAYDNGVLRVESLVGNEYFGPSGSLDVTVELPAGSRIEATAGSAEFRTLGRLGDVIFDGAHGSVHLEETAALRLTVQAADVTVGRVAGDSRITVANGDIHITEALHGTLALHTQAGHITVGAARGVSATLDAGTSYGRVENALRNTQGAESTLNIHATTSYGDITARSV
ncbi:hypothetical protein DWB77_00902 [Streptomyces hundungensis]|uniref:DUF4097 domain-containing protein n=2 Tax=Streptomyces hundungensis TaxID=1077946 RepID=A0A387H5U5_9ACTN|nr:hypothetical protein DWB77_00902 [Streptomyces hundungensis]